jgi:CheY-like chemotaxis protein
VLVVEDDLALRELERVVLEEAGYRVLAASSGPEALVAVGRQRPDIVLVDMVLPGMSGPELVEELAARGSDVPIIFVSGYGSDELASRAGAAARAAATSAGRSPSNSLRGAGQVQPRRAGPHLEARRYLTTKLLCPSR